MPKDTSQETTTAELAELARRFQLLADACSDAAEQLTEEGIKTARLSLDTLRLRLAQQESSVAVIAKKCTAKINAIKEDQARVRVRRKK